MKTTRRLQTVSFNYENVLYEFTGVVGIEFEYPCHEETAIGLKCMVSREGDLINDSEYERIGEIAYENGDVLSYYVGREENRDKSITYIFSTSMIKDMRVQDSEEYYTEKGWCKEQVEDNLSRYL